MNEYIEIAKEYSTPKSKIFINGVLDKTLADLKAQGLVKKAGKGLIGG
jgi:N utilization substance protein B